VAAQRRRRHPKERSVREAGDPFEAIKTMAHLLSTAGLVWGETSLALG
jgi:hypothetical protein